MYLTAGLHRSVQKRPDPTPTRKDDRRPTYKQQAHRVAILLSWGSSA
jgi:hypothetical protein